MSTMHVSYFALKKKHFMISTIFFSGRNCDEAFIKMFSLTMTKTQQRTEENFMKHNYPN
jgi:hypothetical protein